MIACSGKALVLASLILDSYSDTVSNIHVGLMLQDPAIGIWLREATMARRSISRPYHY